MRAALSIATLFVFLGLLVGGYVWAQDAVFVCPMDPDVRSSAPATCPRCGMNLASGIPEAVEYHLDLTATPRAPKPLEKTRLEFSIHDPWKDRPGLNFQLVHEKL